MGFSKTQRSNLLAELEKLGMNQPAQEFNIVASDLGVKVAQADSPQDTVLQIQNMLKLAMEGEKSTEAEEEEKEPVEGADQPPLEEAIKEDVSKLPAEGEEEVAAAPEGEVAPQEEAVPEGEVLPEAAPEEGVSLEEVAAGVEAAAAQAVEAAQAAVQAAEEAAQAAQAVGEVVAPQMDPAMAGPVEGVPADVEKMAKAIENTIIEEAAKAIIVDDIDDFATKLASARERLFGGNPFSELIL